MRKDTRSDSLQKNLSKGMRSHYRDRINIDFLPLLMFYTLSKFCL